MLCFGSNPSLGIFDLVSQCVVLVFQIQRCPLAWAHRDMPEDFFLGIGPVFNALVAGISVRIFFLPVRRMTAKSLI